MRRKGVLWLLTGSMLLNIYVIFEYAPVERTMGVVQKIFYFHVAAAWVGLLAFAVVCGASLAFLMTRHPRWDALALASAEIGAVFTTIVLVTGSLWARSVWNTWWTWDPRLSTTLVLWFIYLAYIALQRSGAEGEGQARLAAVYGIIAFVNVPLVFFSIRWWRTIHPVVIRRSETGLSGEMLFALIFSVLTFSLLYLVLLGLRYQNLDLTNEVRMLRGHMDERGRGLR